VKELVGRRNHLPHQKVALEQRAAEQILDRIGSGNG
jgi:hypothetical protein